MSAGVIVYSPYLMLSQGKKKVAVIGAGTVGLSAALKLAVNYGQQLEITVIAAEFLQQTTSYSCGGLWEPYQIAGILHVCTMFATFYINSHF